MCLRHKRTPHLHYPGTKIDQQTILPPVSDFAYFQMFQQDFKKEINCNFRLMKNKKSK